MLDDGPARIAAILTLHVRLTIILHEATVSEQAKPRGGRKMSGAVLVNNARLRRPMRACLTRGGLCRCGHRLRITGRQAFAPVVGNRPVDDSAAVDALPCVEDQKEV